MPSWTAVNNPVSYPQGLVNNPNPGTPSVAAPAPAPAAPAIPTPPANRSPRILLNHYRTGPINTDHDDPNIHLRTLSTNGNNSLLHNMWKEGEFEELQAPGASPSPKYLLRRIPLKLKNGSLSKISPRYPDGIPSWKYFIYQILARAPPAGLKISTLYRLGVHWCPGLINEDCATNNQSCRAAAHHGNGELFENVEGRWRLRLIHAPAAPAPQPNVPANESVSDSEDENEDDNTDVPDNVPAQPGHSPQGMAQQALALFPPLFSPKPVYPRVQIPAWCRLPPIRPGRQRQERLPGCGDLLRYHPYRRE